MDSGSKPGIEKWFRHSVVFNYHLAAGLLLIAGILKLREPAHGDILQTLFERGLLSFEQVVSIIRFQPWAEAGLGVLALTGWHARRMAKLLCFLYLFFSALILYASSGYLSLPLDCGCFGEGGGTPVYLLLARNFALAALLAVFNGGDQRRTLFYTSIRPAQRIGRNRAAGHDRGPAASEWKDLRSNRPPFGSGSSPDHVQG